MAPLQGASGGCWVADPEACLRSDELLCCVTGPKGLFFRGKYVDIEPRWYTTVGMLVATTLVVEFLVGFLWPLWLALRHRLRRRLLIKSRTTLSDVVALYIGPTFDVPRRIARAYAFLSVNYHINIIYIYIYIYIYINKQYIYKQHIYILIYMCVCVCICVYIDR